MKSIHQNLSTNKSMDSSYTLNDASDRLGISPKDLIQLLRLAKDLGSLAKLKTSNPEEFLNQVNIVSNEAERLFNKLDSNETDESLNGIRGQFAKLKKVLNNDKLKATGIKVAYKIISKIVIQFIKLIKDITVGDFDSLSPDAASLLLEAKVIFKLLVMGLGKLKPFVEDNILPKSFENIKVKIDQTGLKYKSKLEQLRMKTKSDFFKAGNKLKNEAANVNKWFKKVFTKFEEKVKDKDIIDKQGIKAEGEWIKKKADFDKLNKLDKSHKARNKIKIDSEDRDIDQDEDTAVAGQLVKQAAINSLLANSNKSHIKSLTPDTGNKFFYNDKSSKVSNKKNVEKDYPVRPYDEKLDITDDEDYCIEASSEHPSYISFRIKNVTEEHLDEPIPIDEFNSTNPLCESFYTTTEN